MEKYKLIKLYPGSPELGLKVSKTRLKDNLYAYSNSGDEGINYLFSVKEIEGFPEHWEKIEIEEVKKPCLVTFSSEYTRVSEVNLNLNIISIKRLKDNQIFNRNDKVTVVYKGDTVFTIKEIKHRKGEWFDVTLVETNEKVCLSKIKKFREPLFKTQDGVTIREGDEYWYILDERSPMNTNEPCHKIADLNDRDICPLGMAQFSTREKAFIQIYARIPCLSILEVATVFKTAFKESPRNLGCRGWELNTFKLLKLVGKKLNN